MPELIYILRKAFLIISDGYWGEGSASRRSGMVMSEPPWSAGAVGRDLTISIGRDLLDSRRRRRRRGDATPFSALDSFSYTRTHSYAGARSCNSPFPNPRPPPTTRSHCLPRTALVPHAATAGTLTFKSVPSREEKFFFVLLKITTFVFRTD